MNIRHRVFDQAWKQGLMWPEPSPPDCMSLRGRSYDLECESLIILKDQVLPLIFLDANDSSGSDWDRGSGRLRT